jgi:DNA-directed RNA polymerase subunit RPC12/RpoP
MAEFKFACAQCGQHIQCDTSYAGMQIDCPVCQQSIVVPPPPRAVASAVTSAAVPTTAKKSRMLQNILLVITAVFVLAALIVGGRFSYSKIKLHRNSPPPPGVNVFNSFDHANQFDNSVGWGVDSQAGYRGQAEWFVPSGSGSLNVIDLAMMGKGSINVTVSEDKNGLPGNSLESFLNIPSSHFSESGHLVLASKVHPTLSAGTKYWLCVEPADSDTWCSWSYNNQNLANGFAFERAQASWSFVQGGPRNGAFRINVAP